MQLADRPLLNVTLSRSVAGSNSRALERDHAWTGLCIEANPRYAPLFAMRNCTYVQAAVADSEGEATWIDTPGGYDASLLAANRGGARISRNYTVRTLRFDTILKAVGAPRRVDYLSLDVERAEPLVLSSFPFATHRFTIMTLEDLGPPGSKASAAEKRAYVATRQTMRARLSANGYAVLCQMFNDEVWAPATLAISRMHVPVCY